MARAIWAGSISFGLVSIPVGVYSATEDHTVHFHQFERGTTDRVRNLRVNERTGDEVEYGDIVKGADVGDGKYVVVEPDELEAIAPGRSRNLEISEFVDLDEIDPIYYQRTYWLAPTGEEYHRPYALLLQALSDSNRAAIGTFVMRGKEYLAAIRPDRDVLALQTLYFPDEIRDPHEMLDLPSPREVRKDDKELAMAMRLIDAMSGPWKPEQYRDSYRERVEKLIEDKREGREIVSEAEPPDPTDMTDLLAALQRSVEAARGKGGSGAERAGAEKRTGSRKAGKEKKSGEKAGKERAEEKDLRSATKSELLERARELDVSGRSSMSKEQLADAVREAS
ncbi:non-homologous end joining protein Ku [Pseudonocardia sp. T1-2H]|uniref:non-homologous end joining protein Ku n=1 Tax=Pseudonocardia sp. T1-2H TaxID=3128899 RepID=UPI00310169FD